MPSSMKAWPVTGPFKGIVGDLPSGFDPQALDTAVNVVCRLGRLQTRPRLTGLSASNPDGQAVYNLYSFLDALENWHTLALTKQHAYFLTSSGGSLTYNALTLPAGITDLSGTGLPFGLVEMNQQVFFCNGSAPLLYADGSTNVQLAGDVPGACFYLAENSSHLIGVNWVIPSPGISNSTKYPFRVIISDVNNPLEWIPSISNSAVVINLIEKGGVPNGIQTLGSYTYIWRQFGGNILWPSGNASAPFYNDPFSWSNPGWGLFYPYSMCTWNQSGLMVSHNAEVLLFAGASGPAASNWTPLAGGKVKNALAQDLNSATGIVQGFVTDQLGPLFPFEAYILSIPGPGVMWVLNLTDMSWTRFIAEGTVFTALGNVKVH